MGQLQERHDHAERDLATARHDIGTLTAERDHLANQVCGRVTGDRGWQGSALVAGGVAHAVTWVPCCDLVVTMLQYLWGWLIHSIQFTVDQQIRWFE